MSTYSQHQCIIKLDNASASLTDFSSQISSVTINRGNNVGTFHTFGTGTGRDQKALEGGMTTNGSFDVINTDTATELFHVVRQWQTAGGSKTIEVYVPDASTSGSYKITMEIRLAMRDSVVMGKAGSGDAQMMTVNWEADGAVTESTI